GFDFAMSKSYRSSGPRCSHYQRVSEIEDLVIGTLMTHWLREFVQHPHTVLGQKIHAADASFLQSVLREQRRPHSVGVTSNLTIATQFCGDRTRLQSLQLVVHFL